MALHCIRRCLPVSMRSPTEDAVLLPALCSATPSSGQASWCGMLQVGHKHGNLDETLLLQTCLLHNVRSRTTHNKSTRHKSR